jgi:branched-chain amino acid transport system ATP-binding protein
MSPQELVPVIAADRVSVTYGGIVALREVSLSFEAARIVGVIGPNGAGKTTFFDCLSGVTRPTSGRVTLNGVDVTKRSPTWRSRQGVRRTFQRQQTFGHLSVEENLVVALEWRQTARSVVGGALGLPATRRREKERREQAREVLELCGLSAIAERPAGRLTIGQARLVEFARAIVDTPSVLLLDEPTSGLEREDTAQLGELMARTRDAFGTTVVLVEHDVGFVMEHCDSIVVLDLGEVLATGLPAEIRDNPAVQAAYLGTVSTAAEPVAGL